MKVETVLVKGWGSNESVEINKSDFDPKKHELFNSTPVQKPARKAK